MQSDYWENLSCFLVSKYIICKRVQWSAKAESSYCMCLVTKNCSGCSGLSGRGTKPNSNTNPIQLFYVFFRAASHDLQTSPRVTTVRASEQPEQFLLTPVLNRCVKLRLRNTTVKLMGLSEKNPLSRCGIIASLDHAYAYIYTVSEKKRGQ